MGDIHIEQLHNTILGIRVLANLYAFSLSCCSCHHVLEMCLLIVRRFKLPLSSGLSAKARGLGHNSAPDLYNRPLGVRSLSLGDNVYV